MGIGDWGLGIGDWGLGIGDWGLGPIPNPQSPYILKKIIKILCKNNQKKLYIFYFFNLNDRIRNLFRFSC